MPAEEEGEEDPVVKEASMTSTISSADSGNREDPRRRSFHRGEEVLG